METIDELEELLTRVKSKDIILNEQLYIQEGKYRRLAKLCKCVDCGKEWLIRIDRINTGHCRDCLAMGERNGMYGKAAWNKGNKLYSRNVAIKQRKRDIVSLFGNKCHICGAQNLPLSNYQFHHLNREEKKDMISRILLYDWNKLKEELDRCIMVCANCHKTIHHGDERLINS